MNDMTRDLQSVRPDHDGEPASASPTLSLTSTTVTVTSKVEYRLDEPLLLRLSKVADSVFEVRTAVATLIDGTLDLLVLHGAIRGTLSAPVHSMTWHTTDMEEWPERRRDRFDLNRAPASVRAIAALVTPNHTPKEDS